MNSFKTINLIGAFSNTWGAEYHVLDALQQLGVSVQCFDYRKREEKKAINAPSDINLILKGDGISPKVIKELKGPKILWYGESLPQNRRGFKDSVAKAKYKSLSKHVREYDLVLVHDTVIKTVEEAGAKKVFWLSNSGVNPKAHKKLNLDKIYNVGFTGCMNRRRKKLIKHLKRNNIEVTLKTCYGAEFNAFINQCKIFLNIRFNDIPNTETRLHEVLGAGTFCLTEEISMPDMYIDGTHVVYWSKENLDDLIKKIFYYLENEEKREKIVAEGHKMVHENYQYIDRCKNLLEIARRELSSVNLTAT